MLDSRTALVTSKALDRLAGLFRNRERIQMSRRIQMGTWVPFEGPRGGHGAKSVETGEVVYGEAGRELLKSRPNALDDITTRGNNRVSVGDTHSIAKGKEMEATNKTNVDIIRDALENPTNYEWKDLSPIVNALRGDDLSAAEDALGLDSSKRDRTYPSSHVHREMRSRFNEATAHVGHDERVAAMKSILSDVSKTTDPDSLSKQWAAIVGNLTDPQKQLLADEFGITGHMAIYDVQYKLLAEPLAERKRSLIKTGETLPEIVDGTITLPNISGNINSRSWTKGSVGMIHGKPYKVVKAPSKAESRRSTVTYYVAPATQKEYETRKGTLKTNGLEGQAVPLKDGSWFHVKKRKRAAVREDAGMGEVVGHVEWAEGNFATEEQAKKINAKWAKTPVGRRKRIGEIGASIRGDHSYDPHSTSGMTQIAGFGHRGMAGSESLYTDGKTIVRTTSHYDDGPHSWKLEDEKLAKELLEHHKAISG